MLTTQSTGRPKAALLGSLRCAPAPVTSNVRRQMKTGRHPYIVFVNTKAVAFSWIGAALFPFIVEMPIKHPMFWVCAASGVLVVVTVADGIRAKIYGHMSDFVAKTVVPVILLAATSVFIAVAV